MPKKIESDNHLWYRATKPLYELEARLPCDSEALQDLRSVIDALDE
jgi:hypothetical protein